jgi:tetratricopeptide (TPR) repeat protein
VLVISADDVDTLNNKGNALGKLGKYSEATKYYEKAIKVLKSNQSNQSSTGDSHLYSTVTVPIYNYIIVANQNLNMQYIPISDFQNTPQDQKLIIIQVNYAKTLVSIGQYQLAITTYDEILQKDPYNGCVLLGKADALDKSGQHEEAIKDYDIAKKLNPTCNSGKHIQKKVDQPSQIGALVTSISSLLSFH